MTAPGQPGRVFADPPTAGALYGGLRVLDGVSSRSLTAGLVVLLLHHLPEHVRGGGRPVGPRRRPRRRRRVRRRPDPPGPGVLARARDHARHGLPPLRPPLARPALPRRPAGRPVVFFALALLASRPRTRRARRRRRTGRRRGAARPGGQDDRLGRRGCLRAAARGWWREGILRPLSSSRSGSHAYWAPGSSRTWLSRRARWDDRSTIGSSIQGGSTARRSSTTSARRSSFRRGSQPSRSYSRRRGCGVDAAMLAVASLLVACVAVSQLWRVHVSFDYQRVVYYVGVGLALLIGAVFARRSALVFWIGAFVLALVVVARSSVGLRLPERVLRSEPGDAAVSGLRSFREQARRGVRCRPRSEWSPTGACTSPCPTSYAGRRCPHSASGRSVSSTGYRSLGRRRRSSPAGLGAPRSQEGWACAMRWPTRNASPILRSGSTGRRFWPTRASSSSSFPRRAEAGARRKAWH